MLSDVLFFGKSGRHIVEGLLNGMNLEEILESIPSRKVKAMKEEIRGTIQANLSPLQIFLIQSHLDTIDAITKQIAEIDSKISDQLSTLHETKT